MTFRIFSGWDRRQAEAAEVFVYSVRSNASIAVDFYSCSADNEGMLSRRGATAFSYSRFEIPRICNFQGRALFADGCDQLCLGDVRELAEWDMGGRPIAVVKHGARANNRLRSWTSLMLLDCGQLTAWTPEYVATAPDDRLMRLRDFSDDQIGSLPPEWNVLMQLGDDPPPGTKIAHWSALSDPTGGSWIDRSGSKVWAQWRERMLFAIGPRLTPASGSVNKILQCAILTRSLTG